MVEKFVITFMGAFLGFVIWDVIKAVTRKRSDNDQDV